MMLAEKIVWLLVLSSLLVVVLSLCPSTRVSVSSPKTCSVDNHHNHKVHVNRKVTNGISKYFECLNVPCNCGYDPSWTRVAYLDMTDPSQSCPNAWATINTTVRGCGRQPSSSGSCDSVFYSTHGIQYSQVCGRIKAYQYGNPEGFGTGVSSIDTYYVHGVSLTHGRTRSRHHVWTFVNAGHETDKLFYICPCMLSNSSLWPHSVPLFIENNYFCATGSHNSSSGLFMDNPLWDGEGCTGVNTCCKFNQPPWFCRTLPEPTSDDLEVRICADYYTSEENTFISNIEIYVK